MEEYTVKWAMPAEYIFRHWRPPIMKRAEILPPNCMVFAGIPLWHSLLAGARAASPNPVWKNNTCTVQHKWPAVGSELI